MEAFETPILFLVFNRPDKTKVVFEAIRKIKPTKLFVAADGPRHNIAGELEKCDKVRAIATSIDWECELNTLFRDENLGCGKAVSEGITWFFENVEEGIILEDDCLPDKTFFTFCASLLKRYKYDEIIMHIGGNNFQYGIKRGIGDYYFSKLTHIWGWATWRRAWKHYEFDLAFAKQISDEAFKLAFNNNDLFIKYYENIFLQVSNKKIDTWDYQWLYAIVRMNGLAICPEVNLVQNIGFSAEATHTLHETEWNKLNIAKQLHQYRRPSNLNIDYVADSYFLSEIIGLKQYSKNNTPPSKFIFSLKRKVKNLINRII
jgi:hypothetical protein